MSVRMKRLVLNKETLRNLSLELRSAQGPPENRFMPAVRKPTNGKHKVIINGTDVCVSDLAYCEGFYAHFTG